MNESIPSRALRRLAQLRVADVMSKEVVTLSQVDSMGTVSRIFRRQEISSAPVVDEEGRCVGVLSATDFVKREYALQQPSTRGSFTNSRETSSAATNPGGLQAPVHDDDVAAEYMTAGVQAVDPNRSLLVAARMMCDSHIHHLLVLDEQGHPTGLLSTMDIMAALLNAIDEAESVSL